MVLIAFLALELGWEIVSWRAWRLREQYRGLLYRHTTSEASCLESLRQAERELARLEAYAWESPELMGAWPEDTRTAAARTAERDNTLDRLNRTLGYFAAMATHFGQLRRKYQSAVEDPLRPVPTDPPSPEMEPDANDRMASGEYGQALTGYDRLIQAYPDLYWAHQRRAWILATCPDARYRDGRVAVTAATRACELTAWKNPDVLSTLAAAHAESGDFASAVAWEQRALKCAVALGFNPKRYQDQMALYKASKPYRERR
jgi:hypothetical protein